GRYKGPARTPTSRPPEQPRNRRGPPRHPLAVQGLSNPTPRVAPRAATRPPPPATDPAPPAGPPKPGGTRPALDPTQPPPLDRPPNTASRLPAAAPRG